MRMSICVLALTALLPLAAGANAPEKEESQEAKWAKLAESAKSEPCLTQVEIQPYVWIDPSTGNEYSALRFHCPGRDDLDNNATPTPSQGAPDERVSAALRGAS